MIASALITQCRREFNDVPESMRTVRDGDGSVTLFNLGHFPVIEGSYTVYKGTSAQVETTNYTLDKDNGDLSYVVAPASGIQARADFKYAHWRDQHWVEAINNAIEELNARGYFRQVVRNNTLFAISANVRSYAAPTGAVDVYEVLLFDDRTISGNYKPMPANWSYQQDANRILLGFEPSVAEKASISYLRNLQTYTATSATLDVINDWITLVKKKAGANFYRSLAGKIAKQGNANIDEGHFSFTNLRTQARDLEEEFERLALRKKPTRPAKPIQYHVDSVVPS